MATAAIGTSPSRASAPSSRAAAGSARPARAVLRVAAAASVGPGRGRRAAAAMQPAKAVALEAPPVEAGSGAAVAGLPRPDAMGRFGKFGGKYVPETLMHALTELEAAFHALATDDEFQVRARAASSSLCRNSDSRDSLVVGGSEIHFHSLGGFERFGLPRSIVMWFA